MSGHTVPADFSEHMLDLDEDEDLEVFTKNTSLPDGSPMPNSPSSMVNQYRLEDDDEGQEAVNTKDIFVTVDHPESQVTAIETFVLYRVVTRTTRSDFDSSEYEVRRRYQDFVWLRSKLEEKHPTLIVHPLPEKFVMKGMVERFNDDFIETRRRALHRFLNKISEHPILSYSQHFQVFLTAQDLAPHRKQGPGFLSRVGETVRAVANSVRGLKSRPEEFAVMQEYVDDFSNKMCCMDKVTQRIVKEQRVSPVSVLSLISCVEYVDELKQYSPTYARWGELEEELTEPLKGMASCVVQCSKEAEEHIQHLSEVLVPALHEYVLCAETLKLQEEVDVLADRMEQANNSLKGDWLRWQRSMKTDLRSAFISAAEKNVEYYEKCLAVWESFLVSQRADSSGGQEDVA
uniref:Sorting nexin 7 n=1 Tax=Oreochromis niloticus TaxID=8128 RepID=A0A669DRQ8_ORENI